MSYVPWGAGGIYSTAGDNAVVTTESSSTWTLMGNSTLMGLTNNRIIDFNGFIITLADGSVISEW